MTRRMSNYFLKEQLAKLGITFEVDGIITNVVPDSFKTIHISQNPNACEIKKVAFSDYIVHPYDGFDLHQKMNGGLAPQRAEMYGVVIDETEKMYKFDVYTDDFNEHWVGWCPKKSCVIFDV